MNIRPDSVATRTPLNKDFGDLPVGRLGGNNVRKAPSVPKRAFYAIRAKMKSLTSRIARQLKSGDARERAEFKHSLRKTSAAASKLLVALDKGSRGTLDLDKVEQHIGDIVGELLALQDRGAGIQEVVTARLELHLSKLDAKQLNSLRDGLDQAQASPLATEKGPKYVFEQLRAQLDKASFSLLTKETALVLREPMQQFMEAPKHEKRLPGITVRCLRELESKTQELLTKHGHGSDDPAVNRQRTLAYIGHLLDNHIAAHGGHEQHGLVGEIGKAFKFLPTTTLEEFRHLEVFLDLPTGRAGSLAMGALGNRHEEAEVTFKQCAEHLLDCGTDALDDDIGPIHAPSQFAEAVIGFANSLQTFESLANISRMTRPNGMNETKNEVVQHLKDIFKESGMNFLELSHDNLMLFSEACEQLGLQEPLEIIDYEVQNRKDALDLRYAKQINQLSLNVINGDINSILESLIATQDMQELTLARFRSLGEPIDDPIKGLNFRGDLLKRAISSLPPDQMRQFYDKLVSIEVMSLADGLDDVGQRMIKSPGATGDDKKRAMHMMATGKTLGLLLQECTERLVQSEVQLPPLPRFRLEGQASLNNAARVAIREHFKVQLHGQEGFLVEGGNAPPVVGEYITQSINSPIPPEPNGRTEDGRGTGVSASFWRDFGRVNFVIHKDGENKELVSQENFNLLSNSERDERCLAGVRMLRDFCDGDQEMLQFVSQRAHQGLLGGLTDVLNSEHSPIKLPDGTPGMPYGKGSPGIQFSKSDNGDIHALVSHRITEATVFMSEKMINGIPLDPSSHAEFSYQVTFTKDRQVRLNGPVTMNFQVKTI